jgi:glycosyltransferase involved in cell wall biosynthesis
MNIVYLATGAANMYCGSCMHDNTLAAALRAAGQDVTLVPLYTPMRLDEENVSEGRVFYGGIQAYLLQALPRPSWWRTILLRLAGSQALLRLLPHVDIGRAVDPQQNAELTISMLRGEEGNQRNLLEELLHWLENDLRPDLIYITNTLLSGLAPALRRRLGVPIVCGLHGEDIFLDGLPEPYRAQALTLIRQNSAAIDHFIAISQYYLNVFVGRIGVAPQRVSLVHPGIALQAYPTALPAADPNRPLTIGYLARFSPEKGLHVLVEAFLLLWRSGKFPGLRLRAAGYLSKAYAAYVNGLRHCLRQAGAERQVEFLGNVDRSQKLAFLRSLDVFSIPTIYRDPKGLPVLEALASGVPVVVPQHGVFPEWIDATGGGLLHRPEDPVDLAEKLAILLQNAEQRQEFAKRGQQAVFTQFSAHQMAQSAMAVYQKVLA